MFLTSLLINLLDHCCSMLKSLRILCEGDPEELEASDLLHSVGVDIAEDYHSPVDVQDQLLHFADVEGEVVVLASLCQESDLLPVGRLVIVTNQPNDGSDNYQQTPGWSCAWLHNRNLRGSIAGSSAHCLAWCKC